MIASGLVLRMLTVSFPTVAEPLACAIHGVDVIQPKVGSEGEKDGVYVNGGDHANELFIVVLLLGAGPTGWATVEFPSLQSCTNAAGYSLMLSQLLKLNGASKVVIAANKGIKVDIAKDLEAADEYVELDRYISIATGCRRTLTSTQAKPQGSVG